MQKTKMLHQRLNDETKKINKNKEFNFCKEISYVLKRSEKSTAFVDFETKINLISQVYVMQ